MAPAVGFTRDAIAEQDPFVGLIRLRRIDQVGAESTASTHELEAC